MPEILCQAAYALGAQMVTAFCNEKEKQKLTSDIITVCKQIHHVRIYQMHLYQNYLQAQTALHWSELGYIVQLLIKLFDSFLPE